VVLRPFLNPCAAGRALIAGERAVVVVRGRRQLPAPGLLLPTQLGGCGWFEVVLPAWLSTTTAYHY